MTAALAQTTETGQPTEDTLPETWLTLAGNAVALDPSGALWLPKHKALIVADLHLEKAAHFGRKGQFIPPYDSTATLRLLSFLIDRRRPETIICLGDSFHDVSGAQDLPENTRRQLAGLQRHGQWIWITGNHDPDVPDDLGGTTLDEMVIDGLRLVHEPSGALDVSEIAGHFHPTAKVCIRGRGLRSRAFVTDGRRLILPAFGTFTGGLNVLDQAISRLFHPLTMRTFAIGRRGIYPIAAGMLRPDRVSR